MMRRIPSLIASQVLALIISQAGWPCNPQQRGDETRPTQHDDGSFKLLAAGSADFVSIADMYKRFIADAQSKSVDRLVDHFDFDRALQEMQLLSGVDGLDPESLRTLWPW